jgi:hypothetical protein
LFLCPWKPFIVEAYIDAAFISHHHSKSHTGLLILVGGFIIFSASTNVLLKKELLALTYYVDFVELFQDFVNFLLVYTSKTPIIYQDHTMGCMINYTRWWNYKNKTFTSKNAFSYGSYH